LDPATFVDCGSSYTEGYGSLFDGDGPGCTEINKWGEICGDRSNRGPGTDPLSYYAPRNLFTNAFAPNACELQNNNSGDVIL
jgi:hypothetical protein